MKKIIYIFALLAIPSFIFAAIGTVPLWYNSTTNVQYTYPNIRSKFGFGTTTPTAKVSIHQTTADTQFQVFSVASSTPSATTTLFSVGRTGLVSVGEGSNPNINSGIKFIVQCASGGCLGSVNGDKGTFLTNGDGSSYGGIYSFDYLAGTALPLVINQFGGSVGIGGTTTPYANLSIQSGSGTGDALAIATSTGASIAGYDNDGHRYTAGPPPAISSCGTGTGTVVGDDQSGVITTATAATACTATFSKAYRIAPVCVVTDDSLVGFASIASVSTSAVTFGISSALTGGKLYYSCSYHRN